MDVINFLDKSYTAYHAVKHSEYILEKHGFEKLDLAKKWKLEVGGKYYVVKNGTSVIAFVVGENFALFAYQRQRGHSLSRGCAPQRRNVRRTYPIFNARRTFENCGQSA